MCKHHSWIYDDGVFTIAIADFDGEVYLFSLAKCEAFIEAPRGQGTSSM